MPYEIADESFATKYAIRYRCQAILAATTDGNSVVDNVLPFLLSLFQHHDEWNQKAGTGVRSITTQRTTHGTRCFVLVRADNSAIDISFLHAIKLIPTSRSNERLPQALVDYRNAARMAVQDQIRAFRDSELTSISQCPITLLPLSRENCAVDHVLPLSFDQLLFDFTTHREINPLTITVDSIDGTVAIFADQSLKTNWSAYHADHCRLRLISKSANLQLRLPRINWYPICRIA